MSHIKGKHNHRQFTNQKIYIEGPFITKDERDDIEKYLGAQYTTELNQATIFVCRNRRKKQQVGLD